MTITYSNIQVTKVLTLRGNTIQNNRYTGLPGEMTVDTEAKTIRIHDGVTPGGNVIQGATGASSYGNANVHVYLSNFDGNIVPSANSVYSLGSITNQWRHLYVSSNTIYIGGTPLTITDGNLTVGGNVIQGTGGTNLVTYSGNISASSITLDGATGPIANVAVIDAGSGWVPMSFYATSGGSGTGYSVAYSLAYTPPFASFYSHGTGYRVGDIITVINDPGVGKSNATVVVTELLGVASPGIFVGNTAYKFGADGNLKLPPGGGIVNSSGVSLLGGGTNYSNANVASYLPTYSGNIAANISKAGYTWTFGTDGLTTFPNGLRFPGQYTDIVTANVGTGDKSIDIYTNEWAGGGVEVYLEHDNRVSIQTNNGGYIWAFGNTGNLTFPDSTVQTTAYSNTAVHTYLSSHTDQTIGGNLTIQGNLTVNGNVSYISVNNVIIGDNIINLADLNPADSLDLGFVAHRTPSGQPLQHTGLVRDASANQWRLFSNVVATPGATVDFTDAIYDDLQLGNITSPTITALQANAATQSDLIIAINANVAAANVGIKGYIDLANTIQSGQVGAANLAITAANVGMKGYVDSQTFYSNARVATYLQYGNISNISVAGNVTATYFVGNGALLTGIAASSNYSNVQVAAYLNTNNYSPYSNVNVANYLTTATINTTGNITAGNLTSTNGLYVANITTTGSSGNISGANYITANVILTNGGWGNISQVANIQANTVLVSGNVTAGYFLGNGALLTGIAASSSYSNVQVATYLPTYSGNIANIRLGVSGVLTFPDGTTQITAATGGGSSYSNVNVAAYLNTQGYNLYSNVNVAVYISTYTGVVTASNVAVNGNVTAQYLFGNGSQLTGIPASYSNVQTAAYLITNGYVNTNSAYSNSNVTAYTVAMGFQNYGNVNVKAYTEAMGFANYGNANVTSYLPSHTGNVGVNYLLGTTPNVTLTAGTYNSTFDTLGNVSLPNVYVSGNIIAQNFVGNGAFLTGLPAGYSNVQVATYLPTYGGNITAQNITVSGNINLTGNILQINSAVFYGNTITGFGSLYAGIPGYTVIPQVVAQFTENFNGYSQLNTQNINSGNQASTDYVATANNGTDATYFVDLGIAGSGYDPAVGANNNALGTVLSPNDAYLYNAGNLATTTGGNLVIGTQTPNKVVRIFAGGVNAANVVLTVANTGITTSNITANYLIASGQFLSSLPGYAYSNVNVKAYTESMGFQNYSNVNLAAYLGTMNPVKLGSGAGATSQGTDAVAVGRDAGKQQGTESVAIGVIAGQTNQGSWGVAIGSSAGTSNQGQRAIAIGVQAAEVTQGVGAVAVGAYAGDNTQGQYAIAVGYQAGSLNQPASSIIFNASGSALNGTNAGLYINPVRNDLANVANVVYYNAVTNELTYAPAPSGSSYSNVQVATYLPIYSGNIANLTLGPSGVLTFADGTTQTTAGGGGSNYSNTNVAAYLISSSATFIGNTGNVSSVYPTQANISQIFVGQQTALVSGNSSTTTTSWLLNNLYFNSAGNLVVRNSQSGYNYIQMGTNGIMLGGYLSASTANTVASVFTPWMTVNGTSGLVLLNGLTAGGTVAVNSSTGITTNQTSANIFNTTATTINFGGAATTINMGSTATATGNVFVGGQIGSNTYNLTLRANGQYNIATSLNSNGGFNSPPYANQPVIGGSGTGMTANYSATGGYLSTLTIYNSGTGYRNGDVISVPGGIAGNSFVLQNYNPGKVGTFTGTALYTFSIDGNLAIPGNITATNFIGGGQLLTSLPGYAYSNVNVQTYTETIGLTNYSNVNAKAYTESMGFQNYGNVNVAAFTSGLTNYSNVNVAAYLNTQGYNLYSNTNVIAYLNATGYNLYSNVNVAAYLSTFSGNIANIRLGPSGVLTFPDGTTQTTASAGGGSSYSNVNVAAYISSYTGTLGGTLTNAAQPNITSVGSLTALTVTGNATVGNLVGASANTTITSGVFTTTFDNFGNITAPGNITAVGNVTATYFYGNAAFLTGLASSYGNVQVATYLANVLSSTGNIYAGNIVASGNVNAAYLVGTQVGNSQGTTATYTGNVSVGNLSVTGNLSANLLSITANSITGTSTNTTITAGSYTSTFDNAGNVILPNVYVSGGATVVGTVNSNGGTNGTAFAVRGSGAVSNVALGYFPPAGTAAQMAIRDYSTANSTMYFDTTIGSGNVGGQFQFRGTSSYTQYAQIDRFGVTTPTRPAFRVNGTPGTGQTTSNVNLKSPQTSVVFNQGSYYNDTTGQFTAPVAGLYAVGLNARVNTNTSSQIAVLKNGNNSLGNVVCFWESLSNSGTATHFGVNGTILLAVGDYLSANILLGTITFDGNDNWHVTYIG